MSTATTDLSDAHPELQHVEPIFRHFGGVRAFCGPIRTVKCHEDNTKVREVLEEPGYGAVLVVDGGGSLRCALFGGMLGVLAEKNGYAGVVVYGCVRDSVEILTSQVGVMALAAHPRKSEKRGSGLVDVVVAFGDATFTPGAWLYADDDGIVVAPSAVHL